MKIPVKPDPGLLFTIVLVAVIFSLTALLIHRLNLAAQSYHQETILFESPTEARTFQRNCLEKHKAHATVSESATGIQITCNWQSR